MNDYKSSKSWDLLKKELIAQSEIRGFQTKLAKALKIQPQAVQRYFDENDKTIPGMDRADQMAETIGKPLWKILTPPETPATSQLKEKGHELKASPLTLVPDSDSDLLRQLLPLLATADENKLRLMLRLARRGSAVDEISDGVKRD